MSNTTAHKNPTPGLCWGTLSRCMGYCEKKARTGMLTCWHHRHAEASAQRQKNLLDESDWDRVFNLRCRSKRGETLSKEEFDFCMRAYKENPRRYGRLDARVFNATVPFGSTARVEEE